MLNATKCNAELPRGVSTIVLTYNILLKYFPSFSHAGKTQNPHTLFYARRISIQGFQVKAVMKSECDRRCVD